MTSKDYSLETFTFNKDQVKILTSITSVALKDEAVLSNSFSRVRKYFQAEKIRNSEEAKSYRLEKLKWIKEWSHETCKLLDIDDLYTKDELKNKLRDISLEKKCSVFVVELSTFLPYTNLPNGKKFTKLRFSREDMNIYFQSCCEMLNLSEISIFQRSLDAYLK